MSRTEGSKYMLLVAQINYKTSLLRHMEVLIGSETQLNRFFVQF